ncbi:hypothetical protein LSCM4_07662 [Leishmania orientalis]|uniref:MINDY4 N-terminal dimerisation domain-containing protein n=1 Tax=Leishmania orientalis TaxID=2249476 RepID=A0A836H321_9TRYP|nr:hypothetical protein LSCM4_07662 [Leishmania orientalis]
MRCSSTMTQPTSAAEKEKTARLVESLSRHEQVELLAQALLREYMHRRGLRETLRAFDAENPRDERTISSRALMRHLLNIPVEGRPSRLQPTVSSSSEKPQAPAVMEELCSYRLVKRSYRILDGRRGDEQQSRMEEDPSDAELRAAHAAADAQRAAKVLCEQRQREYEELLAAEEAYQRRREERREKRKQKRKAKRRHRGHQRSRGDADSSDDGAKSGSSNSDDSEDEEVTALGVGFSHESGKATSVSSSRRWPLADAGGGANAAAAAVGAHWQPPGIAARAAIDNSAEGNGVACGATKLVSGGAAHRGLGSDDHSDHEEEADPFGMGCASRQALMARVRAQSEHWPMQAQGNAARAHASSTVNSSGNGGAPESSPSCVPASLLTPAGREAGGRGLGSLSSTRPAARAEAGLNRDGTFPAASFSGSLSATAPAGASGGADALRMRASPIPIPGLSAADAATGLNSAYSSGFAPATLAGKSSPSILVKHVDARQQRDRAAVSDGPIHSYDRTAVPRSSALAGSNGDSNVRAAVRSPSLNASPLSESVSSASFHTLSRSPARGMGGAAGPGGGGGNGLRHGIGFRTSTTSAEGVASASASITGVANLAAGAAKTSRKERRVKLLVD